MFIGVPSDDDEDTSDIILMTRKGVEREVKLKDLVRHDWVSLDFLSMHFSMQDKFPSFWRWFQFNEIYDMPGPKRSLWNDYDADLLSRPSEIILDMTELEQATEEEKDFLGEIPECEIFKIMLAKFHSKLNINLRNVTLVSDPNGDGAIDSHYLVSIFGPLLVSERNFQLHKIQLELKDIVQGMGKNFLKEFLDTQTELISLELNIMRLCESSAWLCFQKSVK